MSPPRTPLERASQAHESYVAHKQAMIDALPGGLYPQALVENLTQAAWKAGYTAAMNWLASNISDLQPAPNHYQQALTHVLNLIANNLADLVPEPLPQA